MLNALFVSSVYKITGSQPYYLSQNEGWGSNWNVEYIFLSTIYRITLYLLIMFKRLRLLLS